MISGEQNRRPSRKSNRHVRPTMLRARARRAGEGSLETSRAAANGRGAAFAGEFRAQLDEERNRRLGRGTNHSELRAEKRKRSKKDKKTKKVRVCMHPLSAVAAHV